MNVSKWKSSQQVKFLSILAIQISSTVFGYQLIIHSKQCSCSYTGVHKVVSQSVDNRKFIISNISLLLDCGDRNIIKQLLQIPCLLQWTAPSCITLLTHANHLEIFIRHVASVQHNNFCVQTIRLERTSTMRQKLPPITEHSDAWRAQSFY